MLPHNTVSVCLYRPMHVYVPNSFKGSHKWLSSTLARICNDAKPIYALFTPIARGGALLPLSLVPSLTCASKVEPHRAVLNKKMSLPWGSPISSAKRWNVVSGTTIRRRHKSRCEKRMNGPYSPRHRYIPVNHSRHCQYTDLYVVATYQSSCSRPMQRETINLFLR